MGTLTSFLAWIVSTDISQNTTAMCTVSIDLGLSLRISSMAR